MKPPLLARKSNRALAVLSAVAALFLWTFADAALLQARRAAVLAAEREWTGRLGLSDLCLFTEARYSRHLSQADLHSPFQDHPAALEHFPSGSLVAPPIQTAKPHANLD